MANETPIIIYTDGACRGNPGPGGTGALLQASVLMGAHCGNAAPAALQALADHLGASASVVGMTFVQNQFFPASERPEILVDLSVRTRSVETT